jgi:hypothetical protein
MKLKEIFPFFCFITWDSICTLYKGRLNEKIMAVSLFMIFISLINPLSLFGVEVQLSDEMRIAPLGLLSDEMRFMFAASVIIMTVFAIIFKAVLIPLLIYIGVVRFFYHTIGRTDVIMALLFTVTFFTAFLINKARRPPTLAEEIADEVNYTVVEEEKPPVPFETIVNRHELADARFDEPAEPDYSEMDFIVTLEKYREKDALDTLRDKLNKRFDKINKIGFTEVTAEDREHKKTADCPTDPSSRFD